MSFYRSQIKATEEFRRVQNLPRRIWTPPEAEKLADDMTQVLKTPQGTMRLRPIQAIALAELAMYGGLLGPIPVGEGKTLVSLLGPYVLEAQRPILLLPAMLIEKTTRERIELSKHWRIPLNIRMISLESQGRVNSATLLDAHRPDVIGIDEAHRLKNPKAAVTRRYVRYMADHPETKVFALSGTICKHSLEDYAHLAYHTLKHNAPLPMVKGELMEWAEVLDENTSLGRVDPGALLELCNAEERAHPRFKAARLGYQRRLLETPGVVSTGGAEVGASLYINEVTYPVNPVTEENFEKLRKSWLTPDGWPLVQAVDVWRHARELAAGFHYVWKPRPPEEWMSRRALWAKFVRETLAKSRTLDSPHQVELAVLSGQLHDVLRFQAEGVWQEETNLLARWKEVEKTFKANTVAVWHDDSALKFCEEWGKKNRGIIWTDHSHFARELSRRTGWDYFGREGVNAAGVPIDLKGASHEGQTIIASRKSNGTGRNLQAWNKNLVTSLPGGADELEQMIARTHRPGQNADEVVVDIVFACAEHIAAWQSAVAGAQMVQDTLGQQQKTLRATIQIDTSRMSSMIGARWTKTLSEKDAGFVLPVL